jgi:hypothetical protein
MPLPRPATPGPSSRRSLSRVARLALTGGCLVAVAVAGSAVPAGASPSPAPSASPRSLQSAKTLVDARINGRLHTLAALKTAINAATALSSAHRATLNGIVTADVSRLSALRTKVDAETTLPAVRADERSMVVDFRVYMLVVPKVRLTIASDVENAAIGRLGSVHDKLAAAIAAAKAHGTDVSAEETELADLAARLSAASSVLSGRADALLAVAPSPDAAAMTAAVGPVRAAVRTTREDLRKAVADARQIRRQLA